MTFLASLRMAFSRAVAPFIKWAGETHVPESIKIVKYQNLLDAKSLWQSGDILLSHTDGEMSDVLIADFWKHAALIVDDQTVVEATALGVHTENAADFWLSKDAVCVLRLKCTTSADAKKAVAWALEQLGRPYDFQLSPSLSQFYCSKLVFDAYAQTMGERFPLKMTPVMDVPVIAPETFFSDMANLSLVYDSRQHKYDGVISETPPPPAKSA